MTMPTMDPSETGRAINEMLSINSYSNYSYSTDKIKVERGSKLFDLIWEFPEIEHMFEIIDAVPITLRIED